MKFIEKNPIIMVIIGIIGISLSSILVKLSAAPSTVTATYRLLWTVILMTPVVLGKASIRKELFHTPPKTVLMCVASGFFLAVHFVLWFDSLNYTSVASSTTIVCTEVIWVAIGFCLFLHGKIPKKAFLAIALSVIGSAAIAFSAPSDAIHIKGVILALLAAIAVAVYMLIGRLVRTNTSTSVYTYLVYCACSIVLLIMCIIWRTSLFAHGISPVIVGLLLSVFSTILGHSIFSWCLKYFSPSFVSASKLCEPVVAGFLALFIFNEKPNLLQLAGGVLVLLGVYWYSRIEQKEALD